MLRSILLYTVCVLQMFCFALRKKEGVVTETPFRRELQIIDHQIIKYHSIKTLYHDEQWWLSHSATSSNPSCWLLPFLSPQTKYCPLNLYIQDWGQPNSIRYTLKHSLINSLTARSMMCEPWQFPNLTIAVVNTPHRPLCATRWTATNHALGFL